MSGLFIVICPKNVSCLDGSFWYATECIGGASGLFVDAGCTVWKL